MRFLGAVLATLLASSLGTLAACASHEKDESVPTAQAVQGASVQIALLDANGTKVGSASGVLLAPRLVLTAGHTISGQYKWQVTSADGKQKVTGSRGMTYDWMQYDSQKAHPRRHDVGVIHLDAPIVLDAYPRLVGDKAIDGMQATRIRGNGASFDKLPITLAKMPSAPHSLLGQINAGETLDTGGAVYNDQGIVGVVSGRGLTTGKLYVARTDQLHSWLSDKVGCAGGTATRTYAAPSAKAECDDAGNPLSSSGSPNGSNPNGNPSSSGTPSSNGGNDGTCSNNNDGICHGAGCGNGGSNPAHPGSGDDDDDVSGGPNGSHGGGSGSGSGVGSSGANGNQASGDDDDDSTNGGPNGQSSGQTGSGTGSGVGSSGANGNQGSSSGSANSSGGSSGSSGHPSSSGGAGSNHSDNDETCSGPNDNPETCPPEPDGCKGSSCGGGYPDDLIEFGSCACGGGHGDDDGPHVH